MTQHRHFVTVCFALLMGTTPLLGQDIDYQVYTDSPRLLMNQRRLRLLKRERERESLRWMQFNTLMQGKARMAEPGFALALWATVTAQPGVCREAGEWSLKSANAQDSRELRQIALVYDWCQGSLGDATQSMLGRKLSASLKDRPTDARAIRSRLFAALAVADLDSTNAQAFLKYAVETWWKGAIMPRLLRGEDPFPRREDLYAVTEILHTVRDNLRADLREGANRWFDELGPVQLLSYYPQPWPSPENEYRIPAYAGKGDPDLREAAFSRAAEMALVSFDGNSQPHQFLQGWLMQDRFLMRGDFGITYEFLWANPYQPGLSYTYMPDLFHGRGQLLTRSNWDEDATWFAFQGGQSQVFSKGQRTAIRPEAKPGPVDLGAVRVFFAASGPRLVTGWLPPPEEGAKRIDEVAFVIGLQPDTRYDVEVDEEEMFEARTDSGGILELKFSPGQKAGVRWRRSVH